MTGRRAALFRALGWAAGLGAAIVVLDRLGRGSLAPPPLDSLTGLRRWVEGQTTVTAAFAIVRLLCVVGAWYLVAVTVLAITAHVAKRPTLSRWAGLVTAPSVRRVLGGFTGMSITAVTAFGLGGAGATSRPAVAVATRPDPASGGDAPVAPAGPEQDLRTGSAPSGPAPPPEGGSGTATLSVRDVPSTADAPEAVARPGSSFWSLAEQRLTEAWSRPPTDAEIAPYWLAMIELNRDRLADPADPDLIFPSQAFELPAVPLPP